MAATSGTGLPVLAVVLSGMGILVVAVVVGVLLVVPAVNPVPRPLFSVPPCIGSGCPGGVGNQPLGSVLAIAHPLEASTGGGNWYNFSVQSAGGGLTWGDLAFQIQGPTGQIVSLFGGAYFTLLDVSGIPFATYDPSTGATTGTTTPIHPLQVISLSAGFQGLSGDALIVVGLGTFQGSISVSIP